MRGGDGHGTAASGGRRRDDLLPDGKGLRLAFLSAHSSPLGRAGTRDTGGMNVYLRELSLALGRRGHQVDLFTRRNVPSSKEEVALGPGARLIYVFAGPSAPVDKYLLPPLMEQFAAGVESFRRRAQQQYDLVFSHYWVSGLAGRLLAQAWQAPHLVMFHTLGALKNAALHEPPEPRERLVAESLLARESRAVVVAAEREREGLIRCLGVPPEKVAVVPCGVNFFRFRPRQREEARRLIGLPGGRLILAVGRIDPVKGLDLLLEAFSMLPASAEVRLLIVGGDEHSQAEAARLCRLAKRLEVAGRVYFAGAVDHRKMPAYYSAADVLVIASRYESFGMIALEALACGTPVVATPVGGLPALVQDGRTGFVATEGTPAALAEKVSLVLEGGLAGTPPELRNAVRPYSWPAVARAMENLLVRILV